MQRILEFTHMDVLYFFLDKIGKRLTITRLSTTNHRKVINSLKNSPVYGPPCTCTMTYAYIMSIQITRPIGLSLGSQLFVSCFYLSNSGLPICLVYGYLFLFCEFCVFFLVFVGLDVSTKTQTLCVCSLTHCCWTPCRMNE